MKLIFIRHGEANINTGKLTLRGKLQVKNLLKYLKGENVKAIYCSPRTRALQSTNILNSKLKVPVYIVNNLNERQILPLGKERYQEEYFKNYLNYAYENSHFETCKQYIDRNIKVFDKIKSKHNDNESIIVIAHSATLSALNAYVNGIPFDQKILWLQCSNGTMIKYNL